MMPIRLSRKIFLLRRCDSYSFRVGLTHLVLLKKSAQTWCPPPSPAPSELCDTIFVVSHAFFAVCALCHDATHHDRGVSNHLPSSYERKNSTAKKKLIHEKLNGVAKF